MFLRKHPVFITGGTGYIGQALIQRLIINGYDVTALTRPQSAHLLPPGCQTIVGDVFQPLTFCHDIPRHAVWVHLIGTPHPAPWKAAAFDTVDLASVRAMLSISHSMQCQHFVYISVAHPALLMRAYQRARLSAEQFIISSGVCATLLRPWYILGPGHTWPLLFKPLYWLAEKFPTHFPTLYRLRCITRAQMVASLLDAIESAMQPNAIPVRTIEIDEMLSKNSCC